METKAEYDVNTQERVAFRARCEHLAAQFLSATVDVRVVEVDELEEQNAVVEDRAGVPAA